MASETKVTLQKEEMLEGRTSRAIAQLMIVVLVNLGGIRASCKTVGRGALETSYDVNRTEQDSGCLILAVAAIFPRIWTQTHTSSVSAGVGFDRRSCTSRVRNYVINRIS